jgi:hypothetical protein
MQGKWEVLAIDNFDESLLRVMRIVDIGSAAQVTYMGNFLM